MSSVSKYANLPGIAWDQPDLYETNDLPEADQGAHNRRADLMASQGEPTFESGESLEVFNIDAKKSFQRFEAAEYGDMVSEGCDETPMEQFRRLENEVINLAKNLELIQKTREGRGQDFGEIMTNIFGLENKLKSCRLAIQEIPDDLDTLYEGNQLAASSTPKKVTSKDSSSSKLASLENRIKKLESLLDYDDDKLTSIFYFTNEKSLTEAVRSISNRVAQMDQSTLDQIDHRVSSLIQKLSQLSDKKSILEETQNKSKISELYEMVNKVEKNMSVITEIAARLNILSEIEEEALNFGGAFANLDKLQSEIEENVKQNSKELSALKTSFNTNFQVIKDLMSSIDKRITNLK